MDAVAPLQARESSQRYWWSRLAAVAVLAAVLRIAWALVVPVVPQSDPSVYDLFARNLASGIGYAWSAGDYTAYWPAGTSMVYAGVYLLFGFSYVPVVALNVAVGCANVVLTAVLARRHFGDRAGLLAGLAMALWPCQIEFTTILASEPLFILLLLATWAWLVPPYGPWLVRCIACGVLLAMASLVRPTALLLPVVFALAQVRWERRVLGPVAQGLASAVVMLGLLTPWAWRNQQRLGAWVWVSTNGGANLWMGNNPRTTGTYMPLPPTPGLDEVEADRHLRRLALEYIRDHPLAFVWRTLVKALRQHERESIGVVWNAKALEHVAGPRGITGIKLVSNAYWWAMLGLGLWGAGRLLYREGAGGVLHPILLVWLYFTLVHAVSVYGDRYHLPAVPSIAMLTAFAVAGGNARTASAANAGKPHSQRDPHA